MRGNTTPGTRRHLTAHNRGARPAPPLAPHTGACGRARPGHALAAVERKGGSSGTQARAAELAGRSRACQPPGGRCVPGGAIKTLPAAAQQCAGQQPNGNGQHHTKKPGRPAKSHGAAAPRAPLESTDGRRAARRTNGTREAATRPPAPPPPPARQHPPKGVDRGALLAGRGVAGGRGRPICTVARAWGGGGTPQPAAGCVGRLGVSNSIGQAALCNQPGLACGSSQLCDQNPGAGSPPSLCCSCGTGRVEHAPAAQWTRHRIITPPTRSQCWPGGPGRTPPPPPPQPQGQRLLPAASRQPAHTRTLPTHALRNCA